MVLCGFPHPLVNTDWFIFYSSLSQQTLFFSARNISSCSCKYIHGLISPNEYWFCRNKYYLATMYMHNVVLCESSLLMVSHAWMVQATYIVQAVVHLA